MPYRKGKHWMARVQKNGEIRTKQCETRADAQAVEVAMREEDWSQTETRTVTVLEWVNEYLDFCQGRFAASTLRGKRIAFSALFRELAGVKRSPVQDLSANMALRLLRTRAIRNGGNVANHDRKHLGAAWEWGKKFLLLPEKNPFKAVPRFPADENPRRVPTEEEFWRVYQVARDKERVLLLFLLHTAARRGEALRLMWSDVNLDTGAVQLSTRKRSGGSLERDTIPMTKELTATLRTHRVGTNSLFVFSKPGGQRYKTRGALMAYLCSEAGVEPFGFHAIRHLSASILDRAGMELSAIQAILRHRSATTTARYLHNLRGVRVALDEAFGGTATKTATKSGAVSSISSNIRR